MLLSGADVGFVAAAVQSWSLPQLSHREATGKVSNAAQKNLAVSVAILLLAALANIGQGHIVSGTVLGKAIVAWLAIEVVYFICGQTRYALVNRVVEVPLDVKRIAMLKQRFLSLASFMPVDFLTGWFMGAPLDSICRRNVEDFIAYGFYCRTYGELPPKIQASVSEFAREVEAEYKVTLRDGYNPDIRFMAHMWEPLRTLHTPLCVHLASESLCCFAHLVLTSWGFRKHSHQGIGYWYRSGRRACRQRGTQQGGTSPRHPGVLTRAMASSVHSRGDSASSLVESGGAEQAGLRPLVFMHGVGFGILPYLGFLWQLLQANGAHPLIVMDLPHVALRPFQRAQSVDAIAAATTHILRQRGFSQACFVGHSFGTFCVSRVCQLFPEIVDSIVVMDPVCCLTCYPRLLFSFLYKTYSLREAVSSLAGFANIARFFISRDLIIAETFCRQFLWHSLMLWPEDMPAKAVLSVSANDDLVPADLVVAHLRSSKSQATVMYHPTAAHGGIFLDRAHQAQLISHIKSLLSSR